MVQAGYGKQVNFYNFNIKVIYYIIAVKLLKQYIQYSSEIAKIKNLKEEFGYEVDKRPSKKFKWGR